MEPYERLRKARIAAGYAQAVDAARAFGWPESAYISHENGHRGIKPRVAEKYASGLRVRAEWLLYGKGKTVAPEQTLKQVPLVGWVGAGAQTTRFPVSDAGDLGHVTAPDGANEQTVAVEIRGESLGALFDRWLVFYDDVQRPVTTDHFNRLCVVGLPDGRILIKKVQKSRTRANLFHLLSNTEAPILDVEIEWAARVTKHGAAIKRGKRRCDLFWESALLLSWVLVRRVSSNPC